MVGFVVHIVEVELGAEVRALWAGEEVQAPVEAEDGIGLLDNRRHGGHYHDIVVACSAGEFLEGGYRISAAGVYIMYVDPTLCKHLFSVKGLCTVEAALVDIRNDKQGRNRSLAVQHVVDHCQSHRADTCEQGKFASFLDFHLVFIRSGSRVIVSVESANHAADWFAERCRVEGVAEIAEEALLLHHLVGDDDVGGVAAAILV